MRQVTNEGYQQATRDYIGWCTVCEEFTRDSTEGDASEYDCPKCEGNTVMGAENALILGEITVDEEGGK